MYATAGIYHFIDDFYENIMPLWMPYRNVFNILGGIVEIILAVLLLPVVTRRISAWLIIAMLVIFLFVIHIPMTIDFYLKGHSGLWISIIRLPIQFLLIWWVWLYTKPISPSE